MSFSNDARLINKDLGRIIAETTPSPKKKKHCLPQTSWTWITWTGPRPSPVLYTFSNSRELRVNICEASKCFDPVWYRDHLRWIIQLKGKSSTGYESVHFSILSVIVHFCHWNWTSHSLVRSSKLVCPRKRTGRTDVDHSFGRVRFRGKNRRSWSLENLSVSCEAERCCLFYYCYLGEGRVGILFLFIFL